MRNALLVAASSWLTSLACATGRIAVAVPAEPPPTRDVVVPEAPLPPHALARVGRATLIAFPGVADALAFSPDGATLAAAALKYDDVRLYDVATFTPRTLLSHPGGASALAYAPAGIGKLASCGSALRVHDLADPGRPPLVLATGLDPYGSLAWSADGAHLLYAWDEGAMVYDVASGERLARASVDDTPVPPNMQRRYVSLLAITLPDGRVGALSGELRFVFEGGRLVREPPPHDVADLLGATADGRRVVESGRAYGFTFNDPRLVDLGATAAPPLPLGPRDALDRATFSADGASVLVTRKRISDYAATIVDTRTGEPVAGSTELTGLASDVAAWSPDGTRLAFTRDRAIVLRDPRGELLPAPADATTAEGFIVAVATDSAHARLATLARDTLRIWDIPGGDVRLRMPVAGPLCAALDLDRDLAVFVEGHGEHDAARLVIVDLARGVRRAERLAGRGEAQGPATSRADACEVALGADAALVVRGGELAVYALTDGALVQRGAVGDGAIPFAGAHDQGAVAMGADGRWELEALAAPAERRVVSEPFGELRALSGDGTTLVGVLAAAPDVVVVRKIGAPRWTSLAPVASRRGTRVAVSRDGTRVVDVGAGGVRIHDAATGALSATRAPWAGDDVTAVALSPDGGALVTGHRDGTAFLWSLPSLEAPAPRDLLARLPAWERPLFHDGTALDFVLSGIMPPADPTIVGPPRRFSREPVRCVVTAAASYERDLHSMLTCASPRLSPTDLRSILPTHLVADGVGLWRAAYRTHSGGGGPRDLLSPHAPVAGTTTETLDDTRTITLARGSWCLERRSSYDGDERLCFGPRGLERRTIVFHDAWRIDVRAVRPVVDRRSPQNL